MALSASGETRVGKALPKRDRIGRGKARELADVYLMHEVGSLTSTGAPTKVANHWRFPILLGNAIQGSLGEVGTIDVNAESGHIELSHSYEELVANAERLARGSA